MPLEYLKPSLGIQSERWVNNAIAYNSWSTPNYSNSSTWLVLYYYFHTTAHNSITSIPITPAPIFSSTIRFLSSIATIVRFASRSLIILGPSSSILSKFHPIAIVASRSPKSILDPFFFILPLFFFASLSAHHDIALMPINPPHQLKDSPSLPLLYPILINFLLLFKAISAFYFVSTFCSVCHFHFHYHLHHI